MMQDDVYFSGGVFSDAIDGGRAAADIELRIDGIAAMADGRQFVLRYSDCNVDIGGYNDKIVFCRNEDRSLTIFCEDKSFAAALGAASGGLLDDALNLKKKQLRKSAWAGRGYLTIGLIVSVLACVGLYFGVKVGGAAAVKSLPVGVDREIGERSYDAMKSDHDELRDEVVVAAIQQMVDQLAPHAAVDGLAFDVHVVRSEQLNAFALPGGIIVVYTGLIERADRPEQVAGVIAHEIAHATLRHGLQRVSQSLGLSAAAALLLGDMEGMVVLGAELFQLATINSYSRGQETEADLEGVRMLHAAGIDPNGLSEFFEIVQAEMGDLPDGLEWMSTHPEHEVRILSVRARMKELGEKEYEDLDIDWEAVKSRLD